MKHKTWLAALSITAALLSTGCSNSKASVTGIDGLQYIKEKSSYTVKEDQFFLANVVLKNTSKEPTKFHIKLQFEDQEVQKLLGDLVYGKVVASEGQTFTLEAGKEYVYGYTEKLPAAFPQELKDELKKVKITLYDDDDNKQVIGE
ncbi:hypothetical protein [Ectobacillus ponti]|uniref:DUF4352 domain-containing protein n=1 Tax=Ectobacillus ponti TaxID=2961894 RepID=A0AA41X8P6_9BACI|nr:hypothetical protein [Ectobacillus ponti]MCP8968430.1 hypothetical protein [Ectobacillus ponti]